MISRPRRIAVLVLSAVFLVGLAGGWMLEDVADDLDWPSLHSDRPGRSHDHDDALDDDAEEHYLESLGLTHTQREEVDRLLDQREDRLEAYWAGRLPEIETLVDSTRVGIRALLTPAQREEYDHWIARQGSPTTK